MAKLSYQEKSIWSSLIILVAAAVYFYWRVFEAYAAGAPPTSADLSPLILSLIVLMVGAEAGLHVTLSLCGKEEPKDERDVLVDAKSARNAYYILISGLVIFGGHAAAVDVFGLGELPSAMTLVLGAVLAVVIAEVGHYVSQLVYYRRGI